MRKGGTRGLVIIAAAITVALMLSMLTCSSDVWAADITVSDITTLQDAVNQCNNGAAMSIRLDSDITGITDTIRLTGADLVLDLNGHTISGNVGNHNFIFSASNQGSFTITDSNGGSGSIENTNSTGGAVFKTGGKLSISGGNFLGGYHCIKVSDSEADITGGNYSANHATDGVTFHILGNSNVHISGNPGFTSNYGTVFVPDDVTAGSLTIEGGTFTSNENGAFGYTCYIGGKCNLNISGGTFILNNDAGKSLFIGTNATDADVSISGGTFIGQTNKGGIGRAVSDTVHLNYTAFYGDDNGKEGILAQGYVLTDNQFQSEPGSIMDTSATEISVVPGTLVMFDTQRSTVEEYGNSESEAKETADFYSLAPVSVGTDGHIYANGSTTISFDETRIKDGNVYEWNGWYDANGNEFASVDEYVTKSGKMSDAVLKADYNVKVSTQDGLFSALKNQKAVKAIEVANDISLSAPIQVDTPQSPENKLERTLDFSNNTVQYANTSAPAFVLKGIWTIKNGVIESQGQACIQLEGTAVLENLECKSQNFSYAVGFSNVTDDSKHQIITGKFETTVANGHALAVINGTGKAENITNLFGGSYASSQSVETEANNVYLNASKLIVSKTPITYIDNGADLDMGTFVYGDSIPKQNEVISNQNYVGDITITGISVDHTAFLVKGESESKVLLGGSTDTYRYTVEAAGDLAPGEYAGTISIRYTKMDDTEGTYKQKVSIVVEKASGTATVTIADYHVGEVALPIAASDTNGTNSVRYYYKEKNAGDDTYTRVAPEEEGSYTLKAVFAATKYYAETEATADFKVTYIATPEDPYYILGTKGENGWYTTDVTIYPAAGYSISAEKKGVYSNCYVVEKTAEPIIYLKNENGAVTRNVQVEKILIDKEAPDISGVQDGKTYYDDALKADITDENLAQIVINGENILFEGTDATISLKPSDKKYIIVAKDQAGNIVRCTVTVEEAWMKKGIVSNGVKKLKKGKSYKLGSGQWKITGDNTVYYGGKSFYVSADGNYDFQKQ